MYGSFSSSVTFFHISPSFLATSVTESFFCGHRNENMESFVFCSATSWRTAAVQSMYADKGRFGQLGSLGAFTIFVEWQRFNKKHDN